MSNGYTNKNLIAIVGGVTCSASETTTIANIKASDRDSLNLQAYVKFSSVWSGGTLEVRIEDSPDNGTTWRSLPGNAAAPSTADIDADTVAEVRRLSGFTDDMTHGQNDLGGHVIIEDVFGNTWGVGYAQNANEGAEITDPDWYLIDASRRVVLDSNSFGGISNLAQVFKTAFEGLTGFGSVFTVAGTAGGLLTFTAVPKGITFGAPSFRQGDGTVGSSVGTITPSVITPASSVLAYQIEQHTQMSGAATLYPNVRIVVEAGANSGAEVESVYVTRRL